MSSVLGAKVFCGDVAAADLVNQPLTVEVEFAPAARSGEHVHPNQEESFKVLTGILARGRVPGWRYATETAARAVNTHDPGLRTQEYWERMEQFVRQRKVTGMSGLRNGIYLRALAKLVRRSASG